MIRNLKQIASDYDRIWNESIESIRMSITEIDPIPAESSRRWGISIVFRPTEPSLGLLADFAKKVGAYSGTQVVYNETNLHTTVLSLEFFRTHIAANDARVQTYIEALQLLAREHASFTHRYSGLTVNRLGVMAQGWPEDDTLQDIREALRAEMLARGVWCGPDAEYMRQTSHASLLVFTKPISNPADLVAFVKAEKMRDFGECNISKLEIVSYIRTENNVALTELGCCALQK